MNRRRDRIDKLRRLSTSDNIHEAARAREALARLLGTPATAERRPPGQDPAYPHQLPGSLRIPTPIGGRKP